jgi:hypothetical protein
MIDPQVPAAELTELVPIRETESEYEDEYEMA